jgi:hypothetical protein
MVRHCLVICLNYGLELRERDVLKLLIHRLERSVFAPTLARNGNALTAWGNKEIACLAVDDLDRNNYD